MAMKQSGMAMKQSGFTLLEVIVTVAIAAILVTVAAPSMQVFLQNGRIVTATNDLVSGFAVARAEAIKQSGFSCICASTNPNDPAPACSGTNTWESGWVAFFDVNGNCVFENGAQADILLKVWDGSDMPANFTIRNTNLVSNTILFNSRGEPQQPNGRSLSGLFRVCDERGLQFSNGTSTSAAAVVLSASGRARASRSASKLTACP